LGSRAHGFRATGPAVSVPERALAEFALAAPRVERIPVGLIHESFGVRDGAAEYVLQRVSPIFAPGIHDNILAVTEHLHAKGIETLRLVPTRGGALFADLGEAGRWRLVTRVRGVVFDTCASPAQARAAGALVARFHGALADLDHVFRPLGIVLHDTEAHLAALEAALRAHRSHPLWDAVAALAAEILPAARAGVGIGGLPARIAHGDLKFNNVLFAGEGAQERERAVSLIDLDTLSRLPLWVELGDAWRSWCNRRGEDSAEAELDLGLFRASAEGWLGALGFPLLAGELESLALGLERIALELAARFAADALVESYFGWDPARFASRGEHNLLRARGQLSLFRQARETRSERQRALGVRAGTKRA
jgi:Ser/Thr protein kinase RdoA (MazF antagonist)